MEVFLESVLDGNLLRSSVVAVGMQDILCVAVLVKVLAVCLVVNTGNVFDTGKLRLHFGFFVISEILEHYSYGVVLFSLREFLLHNIHTDLH